VRSVETGVRTKGKSRPSTLAIFCPGIFTAWKLPNHELSSNEKEKGVKMKIRMLRTFIDKGKMLKYTPKGNDDAMIDVIVLCFVFLCCCCCEECVIVAVGPHPKPECTTSINQQKTKTPSPLIGINDCIEIKIRYLRPEEAVLVCVCGVRV
jgi:hypothetical protein